MNIVALTFTFLSTPTCLVKTVVFLNIEYEHGQNDFGISKMLSVRCAAKKVV